MNKFKFGFDKILKVAVGIIPLLCMILIIGGRLTEAIAISCVIILAQVNDIRNDVKSFIEDGYEEEIKGTFGINHEDLEKLNEIINGSDN